MTQGYPLLCSGYSELMMASLFIKDAEAANRVRAMAGRLGTTNTEAVRLGMAALEEKLGPAPVRRDFAEQLREHRRLNPLPPHGGRAPDKAFWDWLSGEDAVGAVR